MISTLLINHIVVGNIEIDDMSGVLIPCFKTYNYIEEESYSVLITDYHYDTIEESIYIKCLLTEFNDEGIDIQTSFVFSSKEQVKSEDWEEFYQLKEEDKPNGN
jgi:hypothetical protein